eukprot:15059009-Alexandrium_andersonii.AAC.1
MAHARKKRGSRPGCLGRREPPLGDSGSPANCPRTTIHACVQGLIEGALLGCPDLHPSWAVAAGPKPYCRAGRSSSACFD